ncbi:hypothetical protein [Ehrlichia japonica]|uniref:Uncharacterized protein n=1 Tax=Ehrlichia japonica TaxID=391036 RepID=X5H054_9RICK|nr:hypothetical protein [Ehrlichia japonica]AHX04199.1 hypothetical protein EHF_0240 [Ehrlichia japonica]
MDTSGIIGLVVGILVFVFLVVLYYLIRSLLKPKLHLKSDDVLKDSVVDSGKKTQPNAHLQAAVIINFDRRTATNAISVARDLRFQLSSVYCYQNIVRHLVDASDECIDPSESSPPERITNLDMKLCQFAEEIKNSLVATIEIAEESTVVPKEIYSAMVDNYNVIYGLGQHLKELLQEVFSPTYDLQTIMAYNLAIEAVRTECTRKSFIFNSTGVSNPSMQR